MADVTTEKCDQSGVTSAVQRRLGQVVRSQVAALADILFPRQCVACRAPVEGAMFCPVCGDANRAMLASPACPRCGGDVAPYQVRDGRCPACRSRRLRVHAIVRVGAYEGRLRALIHRYKFSGQIAMAPALGAWLSAACHSAPWFVHVDAIVPVPTCWRHRIGRPLHAADGLACALHKRTDLPVRRLLRRRKAGKRQERLGAEDRKRAVRDAFAMSRWCGRLPETVLLVDDVATTGATLEACAKVLRAAGVERVFAAVVAKTSRVPRAANGTC